MDQMKLIIPWYKLIAQTFKHQDSKNVLSKGSSCTILKRRLFFFFNLERKNWVFLKKSLGSSMVLVQRIFFKWLKGLMPLVQRHFSFENFYFFWERFGNLYFFFEFFCFFVLNIYTQTKLIRCYMKFLNSKKHRNKTLSLTMMLQTKCGVRQSWATCFFLIHLGCLRLGVLEL